jgi:hypothetical protein
MYLSIIILIVTLITIFIVLIQLCLNIVLFLYFHVKHKRFIEIFKAFEDAFNCNLLGDNPQINVIDYPMADKIWHVPCKNKDKGK